jgi:Flp pilus assembly protein protease CpaA
VWDSMESLSPVQWGAVLGASLAGAVIDVRCRKLPNILTVPVFAAGLAWGAWAGGLAGLGESLAAGVLVMLPFVLLFLFAGGGAGDAKMMAGVGAWLGLDAGIVALVVTMICGVVLGLTWSAAQGKLRQVLKNLSSMTTVFIGAIFAKQGVLAAGRAAAPRQGMVAMPYGLAIFAGVCVTAGVLTL